MQNSAIFGKILTDHMFSYFWGVVWVGAVAWRPLAGTRGAPLNTGIQKS